MRQFPFLQSKEFDIFKKLNSAAKVQDFIEALPINFEKNGHTCRSPRAALRRNEAHCMEGALIAAAALWYHGKKPLLLDLKTIKPDDDHVVTLFKQNDRWGAISKTNHAVLRYRDPVYKTVRELTMSYFNEYFLDNGKKTLRSYSAPFSLLAYEDDWLTSEDHLWALAADLDDSRHFPILQHGTILRPAHPIEIDAGKLVQYKKM